MQVLLWLLVSAAATELRSELRAELDADYGKPKLDAAKWKTLGPATSLPESTALTDINNQEPMKLAKCAEECEKREDCRGFVTGSVGNCWLSSSNDVIINGRSSVAEKDKQTEIAWVKTNLYPATHTKLFSFTEGWEEEAPELDGGTPKPLQKVEGASQKVAFLMDGRPETTLVSQKLPCSLQFDLGNPHSLLGMVEIRNAPNTPTGADQVQINALKGHIDTGDWVPIARTRMHPGEWKSIKIVNPVVSTHVQLVFTSFYGKPGYVNISEVMLYTSIGGNPGEPDAIHTQEEKELIKQKGNEIFHKPKGALHDCPILNLKTKGDVHIEEVAQWALKESQQKTCRCAEVEHLTHPGTVNRAAQRTIAKWTEALRSGRKNYEDVFGNILAMRNVTYPATILHTGKGKHHDIRLNMTEAQQFEHALQTRGPPPMTKFFSLKILKTRTKSRGVNLGEVTFYNGISAVDMTGVKVTVKTKTGHGAHGLGPENLVDGQNTTMFYNTDPNCEIIFEFPKPLFVDSVTLMTGRVPMEMKNIPPDATPAKKAEIMKREANRDPVKFEFKASFDGKHWPMWLKRQLVKAGIDDEGHIPYSVRPMETKRMYFHTERVADTDEREEEKEDTTDKLKPFTGDVPIFNSLGGDTDHYALGEGEKHLYTEQVNTQCYSLHCLAYTIGMLKNEPAHEHAHCVDPLVEICHTFNKDSGCNVACDGVEKDGSPARKCMVIQTQPQETIPTPDELAGVQSIGGDEQEPTPEPIDTDDGVLSMAPGEIEPP